MKPIYVFAALALGACVPTHQPECPFPNDRLIRGQCVPQGDDSERAEPEPDRSPTGAGSEPSNNGLTNDDDYDEDDDDDDRNDDDRDDDDDQHEDDDDRGGRCDGNCGVGRGNGGGNGTGNEGSGRGPGKDDDDD